jgi:23S rRNA (uracil-5-)-methyltransferase RumA
MKFGELLQGTITRVDDKGRGMFDHVLEDGGIRPVAIPFTAIGDVVEARFAKRETGVWYARLEKILAASADRVDAPCPHAGKCGGCLWQHMAYPAQLTLKQSMINHAFEAAEHNERVEQVDPSTEVLYYRNRMDYAFGWKGEIGLKEHGSWNRYLDLTNCLLLDEETPKILQFFHHFVDTFKLAPWDAKTHEGLLRYVVIRLGKETGERMIILVVKDATQITEPMRTFLKQGLLEQATTLLIGENSLISDLSYAQTFETLLGNPVLTEEVNGIRYAIHPNSFFQTNTRMAAKLQTTVLDWVQPKPGMTVLDLYCGLGFFGLACAKRGATVFGHELDANAIELAKENAIQNGVADLCTFTAGPAEDQTWKDIPCDVLILDPPRAGLHPKTLEAVMTKLPKTIVYVSCNFHRLAHDLKTLKTKYDVDQLKALDLFPQTPHVETVVRLSLKA